MIKKCRLNFRFSIIQVKIYETSYVIILMLSLLENDQWISFSAWRSLSSHLINLISFLCDCMHLFKFFPLPKLITLKGICCHIFTTELHASANIDFRIMVICLDHASMQSCKPLGLWEMLLRDCVLANLTVFYHQLVIINHPRNLRVSKITF